MRLEDMPLEKRDVLLVSFVLLLVQLGLSLSRANLDLMDPEELQDTI